MALNKMDELQPFGLSHNTRGKSARPTIDLNLDDLPVERTVGIEGNAAKDTQKIRVVSQEKLVSKRRLLSTTSSQDYHIR